MKTLGAARKTALSTLAFSLYLHAASSYAAALDVSQQPLMLVDSVAPNLIFTLDDSRSMWRASVPDDNGPRNTVRAKSSAFNPLYYNPNVTYEIPRGVNSSGTPVTYSTSFTSAYHNGFDTSKGSVDLSKDYRVDWYCNHNNMSGCTSYTGTTIGNMLAENPSNDYDISVSLTNGSSTTITTPGGARYTIRRTASGSCEVTGAGYTSSSQRCTQTSGSGARTARANLTRQPVQAYYYLFDSTLPGCSATSIANDDCYRIVQVSDTSGPNGTDERQNFAIWYSFYRDRGLATISASHQAFYDMSAAVRITWQGLTDCTTLNSNNNTAKCQDNRFRAFGNQHKGNFYSWLRGFQFVGGTPLRGSLTRAGEFLRTDSDAWAYNPNPITGSTQVEPRYTCRPSFHILMTDGMWNQDSGFTHPTRADDNSFTLPDGTEYSGSLAPFADSTESTLADVAMHYWATDLNPNLDNELKPYIRHSNANASTQYWDPRNNPATWQHMSNFMVGLGLSSALNNANIPWTGDTFKGAGYQALAGGTVNWPAASSDNSNNVYDLWHAAINSRGEFFSADSPEDLVKAFESVLNRIAERTATAAKPGVSTSIGDQDIDSFTVTNRLFYSSYDSADWSGDLVRYNSKRFSNGAVTQEQAWSAREQLPAAGSRTIMMAGGGGASGLQAFSYNNLSSDLRTIFNTNPDSLSGALDDRGGERASYIRGDRSKEGDSDGSFRRRSSPLGDIINSSPVVVGTPSYLPYLADRIDGRPGDYLTFQQANRAPSEDAEESTGGRKELVYVGANDGMLHAFNAKTGAEEFAFIPSAVLPNLPRLTAQSYQGGAHRYFVDGTPVVRDVYINSQWRTVLVGTLRAGGKGLFALDITDPGNVQLLWEISNQTQGYGNLGYTFAEPEIVRLHSGQWGILLGNGYDSENDAASLFVIDIQNGNLLKELVVDDGSSGANGLSSVRGADNNGDGVVDYAYAGDLRGNLWRFDLINTTTTNQEVPDPFARSVQGNVQASSFAVSYGGQPLYTARAVTDDAGNQIQPITAIPSLVRHPTRRGYIVIFGTGKYFETQDAAPDTSRAMTVYGIWDRKTRAQSTSTSDRPSISRSNLHEQSISAEQVHGFDGTTHSVRVVSQTPPQWYQDNTTPAQEEYDNRVQDWGWFIDLRVQGQALEGEMMVNRMEVRGDTVLFSSLIPNEDPCADGTSGWIYALNAQTGARTFHPALDFNADGRFDANDTIDGLIASGYKQNSPGGIALSGDGSIFGADPTPVGFSPSPELEGRQSWQVIPLEDN